MFQLHTGLRPLTTWAERTQQAACRNAMAASTALTEQRRERDEVAAYVATVLAHRTGTDRTSTSTRSTALG